MVRSLTFAICPFTACKLAVQPLLLSTAMGSAKSPGLLLPFHAKVVLKPKSTDKQATFDVTLDNDVPAGYHQVRLVNDGGVSLPSLVTVDRLPQRPLVPVIEQLPVALHGTLAGSTIVETSFSGKAGQRSPSKWKLKGWAASFGPSCIFIAPNICN